MERNGMTLKNCEDSVNILKHIVKKTRNANIELLLNHDLVASQSYYKPQEKEI